MRLLAYPMCGHLAYTGYLMGVHRCRAMCAPRSAQLIEMKNHFLIRETIKSQDLNENLFHLGNCKISTIAARTKKDKIGSYFG